MIEVTPDTDVPFSEKETLSPFAARLAAAAATAALLTESGMDIDLLQPDLDVASDFIHESAENPEKLVEPTSVRAISARGAASLLAIKRTLDDFGGAVVQSAVTVRNLITNKLLVETENPDPRVRMRALELLGKINGIDLFTAPATSELPKAASVDMKERLREKVDKLREMGALKGVYEAEPAPTTKKKPDADVSDAEIVP